MSYEEQAKKINEILKSLNKIEDKQTKLDIVNGMLYYGQVAKFRCRNNSAYENFARLCLDGIVSIKKEKLEGFDFEVLRAEK